MMICLQLINSIPNWLVALRSFEAKRFFLTAETPFAQRLALEHGAC